MRCKAFVRLKGKSRSRGGGVEGCGRAEAKHSGDVTWGQSELERRGVEFGGRPGPDFV